MCFPVNFAKFLRTPFLRNTSGSCFWKVFWKMSQNLQENTSTGFFLWNFPTFLEHDLVEHLRETVSVGNKNAPAQFSLCFIKILAGFVMSWLLMLKFILNLSWLSQIVFIYFQKCSDQIWEDSAMVNDINCMYFEGTKSQRGVINYNCPPLRTQL